MALKLWPDIEKTGHETSDAFADLFSWKCWLEQKIPGVLDGLDAQDTIHLYGVFGEFVGEIRKLERIAKLAELIHHCYEVEPMREFLRESGWEILPDGYCSHPEHAPPSGMHPENALSLEMQFAIEALERTGG